MYPTSKRFRIDRPLARHGRRASRGGRMEWKSGVDVFGCRPLEGQREWMGKDRREQHELQQLENGQDGFYSCSTYVYLLLFFLFFADGICVLYIHGSHFLHQ